MKAFIELNAAYAEVGIQQMVTFYLSEMLTNGYFLLFVLLFTLRNLAEIFIQSQRKRPTESKKKGEFSLAVLAGSFLVSGVAAGYFLLVNAPGNVYVYCVGTIFLILGYLGRVVSLKTLGKNYSKYVETGSEHELVVSGIYAIIRHPLYAFYIVELIAFVLIRWNYISLMAVFLVILATIHRIKEEDALLAREFGERFESYRKTTKKLLPFVY